MSLGLHVPCRHVDNHGYRNEGTAISAWPRTSRDERLKLARLASSSPSTVRDLPLCFSSDCSRKRTITKKKVENQKVEPEISYASVFE